MALVFLAYNFMSTTSKTCILLALGATLAAGALFFMFPHTAAAGGAHVSNTATPLSVTSKSTGSAKFISLTNFPLFTQGAGIGGMRAFLNSLYKYLIGIAVILAILEIVWGGLLWMGSGASVTSKEKGKNKINMALAGLLLVLSPYLVFQIINPRARLLTFGNPITLETPTPIKSAAPVAVAPKTGCTTLHSGPFLETAVCAIGSSHTYVCKNGLARHFPKCNLSDSNGKCLDKSTTVYCEGKTTTLTYYEYYTTHLLWGFPTGDGIILPRDRAARNAFVNSCTKDGGVVDFSITLATKSFFVSHAWQASLTNGCPSNSGIIVDKRQYAGVLCANSNLTCNAPNQ